MTFRLSRRALGMMTIAMAGAAVPGVGFAQSASFVHPSLLVEPDELLAIVPPVAATSGGARAEGLVLVDVRTREEYETAHIPGAAHLEPDAVVTDASPVTGALKGIAALEELLGSIGVRPDRRIVFYDDKGGLHAARMLWLLEYLGHRNVAVLHGGWSAWLDADGRTTTLEEPVKPELFQAAPSPRRYASAEVVLLQRDATNAVLIDVRPQHMYADGHIPWAINVPWSENLREDERFRPVDELLIHFADYGVTPRSDIIVHCQVGLASAHSYLALRLLGFPRVRVYHRSWEEWSNDPDLPKIKGA